jgi:aminoglycoside phosphotransferase (APT) family kinase protein
MGGRVGERAGADPMTIGKTQATGPALASAIAEAAQAAGWQDAGVTGLERLAGGASKESWAFDLVGSLGVATPMVLRRQPPEQRFTKSGMSTLADEAAVMRAAGAHGVPVPQIHFELPPGSAAGEGYAMARIAGEAVGSRLLKNPDLADARAGLAHQCGNVLARIHAVPCKDLPGLAARTARQALAALFDRHRATGHERAVFELAFRWLEENLAEDVRHVLVHGDFRNGNLVVGPEGLRGVLDWEMAEIGSPLADLAWLCVNSWRFQRPDLPVGGFGTREQLIAGYVEAGGDDVDPAVLHSWEVMQTLTWGVMCAEVGTSFEEGAVSVESAMIARRASEVEFDLLRLLLPEDEAWHA